MNTSSEPLTTSEFVRRCIVCGDRISACMGFVLARDFVAQVAHPRELCGKCVETMDPQDLVGCKEPA